MFYFGVCFGIFELKVVIDYENNSMYKGKVWKVFRILWKG